MADIEKVREALEQIVETNRALRQCGPAPEDLQDLSDALEEAGCIAREVLSALAREPVGEEEIAYLDEIQLLYERASPPWHVNPAREPREVKLKRPHWEIGTPFGRGVGIIFGDDISTAKLIEKLFNAWPKLYARLRSGATGEVPEGWKIVPIEPTDEMYRAALGVTRDARYGKVDDCAGGAIYRAMLSASPSPQEKE